jgi:hypothetical protein
MKMSFVLVIAAAAALSAGSIRLDRPLPVSGTDHCFQYDDGTANWLSWAGLYRGVWFNIQDWVPGAGGATLSSLEFWFYHHASYPWDTSAFYAELYNGDAAAPTTLLDQTSLTALHYTPVSTNYGESPYPWGIEVEQNFWGVVNTEMSAGGWPSILGDNTPQPVSHSFFSDDFIVWQPWVMGGATANDFFIRGESCLGFEESTWGSIKSLF